MTKQELNRDFKRLHKAFKKQLNGTNTIDWSHKDWQRYEEQRDALKKELIRLYYASDNFNYANRLSILIFMEINNSIRAIAFHQVHTKL